MRTRLIIGLVLVTFCAAFFAPAMAQQQKDPMMKKDHMWNNKAMEAKDLPMTVMNAFKKGYPDTKIDRAWTEKQGDMTVYDVKIMQGDKPMTVVYDKDGNLVETREMIKPTMLPADVTSTVKKAYPNCTMERAEKIMRGKTVEYGVRFRQKGEGYSMVYSPEGKMIRSQKMEEPKTEPVKNKPTGY